MTTLPEIEDKIKHINRVHQEPIGKKPLCAMNIEEFMERQLPKILPLRISVEHFDLMKAGVMDLFCVRKCSANDHRLIDKMYNYVEFLNWTKERSIKITLEYEGYSIANSDHFVKFNDSERIEVKKGDYVIKLGRVVKVSEYKE